MKLVLVTLMLAVGCGGKTGTGNPDPESDARPPGGGLDAPSDTGLIPTWRLEDVQPQSPRFGEVYGLDSFNGKIVVVTLLEGF